ncbi:hypothetical protein CA54_05680 [Symmachiella macrocystis]|uniref:Uncharacterized protein n=1 Tax=Symmachiella macrocystis TaxID=2527985 RepID=A0A5C6BKN1_9PLAN|nr:hypothetical protein CA54_05680 [Symmachiella macrocystis]
MRSFHWENSVLQHFATILTLLVSVLHAGLGCCWHHVHACEAGAVSHCSKSQGDKTCTSKRSDAHCCHHQHGEEAVAHLSSELAEPAPPAEEDGHHHQCENEGCVFVVGSRTTFVPDSQSRCSLDLPVIIAETSLSLAPLAFRGTTEAFRGVLWDCAHAPQWTQTWLL